MGEYREFGVVCMVGEWGDFWWLEKLGQVWEKYRRSGETCWGVGGGKGRCGKMCWGVGSSVGDGE